MYGQKVEGAVVGYVMQRYCFRNVKIKHLIKITHEVVISKILKSNTLYFYIYTHKFNKKNQLYIIK